jgi:hypothetical protein
MPGNKNIYLTFLVACLLLISNASGVWAQSSSPNYKVEEVFFGVGGELDASSANYRARLAAGELAVGSTTSTNFLAQAGFNTTNVELLEVEVGGGEYSLGSLSSDSTSSGYTTFSVRNYLSSGYVVRIGGSTPSQKSGDEIDALTTPTASNAGVEQFGINLVSNSSPAVGADPLQVPDSSFSFGSPSADYGTADLFKFVDEDIIAQSSKSSGKTVYTLSFIANISTNTPAGQYGSSLFINVIPTF